MCHVGWEWYRMGSMVPKGFDMVRSGRQDRMNRMRYRSGERVEIESCGSARPECAPKCAPKVHGAVRAAGYRWQSTGMTLAFTHEKMRIPQGIR
jgi:hypothetical protein